MLLDEMMPMYDFNEIHVTSICASPDRIFHAIKKITPLDVPLFRRLFWIRWLPTFLTRKVGFAFAGAQPIFTQALLAGFVLVAEDTDLELVVGRIGQFWRLFDGSSPRIASAADFAKFNLPGYAKVLLNFYVQKASDSRTNLRTETRIYLSDSVSRKKFSLYWRLIHLGSAIVRRAWLKAIKNIAEDQVNASRYLRLKLAGPPGSVTLLSLKCGR